MIPPVGRPNADEMHPIIPKKPKPLISTAIHSLQSQSSSLLPKSIKATEFPSEAEIEKILAEFIKEQPDGSTGSVEQRARNLKQAMPSVNESDSISDIEVDWMLETLLAEQGDQPKVGVEKLLEDLKDLMDSLEETPSEIQVADTPSKESKSQVVVKYIEDSFPSRASRWPATHSEKKTSKKMHDRIQRGQEKISSLITSSLGKIRDIPLKAEATALVLMGLRSHNVQILALRLLNRTYENKKISINISVHPTEVQEKISELVRQWKSMKYPLIIKLMSMSKKSLSKKIIDVLRKNFKLRQLRLGNNRILRLFESPS